MKIRFTFKNPDYDTNLDRDELDALPQKELKAINEFKKKFFEYDEYVVIEFDTETKQSVLVPV